jgi:transposase
LFLEIRQVYHRKSEKIRAHMFVCALSLLIARIIEKSTGMTIKRIVTDLDFLDVVPFTIGKRNMYISSNSSESSNILKILKLPYPKIRESADT